MPIGRFLKITNNSSGVIIIGGASGTRFGGEGLGIGVSKILDLNKLSETDLKGLDTLIGLGSVGVVDPSLAEFRAEGLGNVGNIAINSAIILNILTGSIRESIESEGIALGSDTFLEGSGTGLAYGCMYADGTQAIRVALTLNTPTEIEDDGTTSAEDGWLPGDFNLITFPTGGTEHYLAVTKAGMYLINWSVSFKMVTGAANTQVHAGLAVDGTPIREKCEAHRTISNNTDTGNMSGSCMIDLPNGNEELSLWMENTTNSNDADVVHGNLSVVMAGGT